MLSKEALKKRLVIDVNNLDKECSEQPVLYQEASEQAALAKHAVKLAKHVVDSVSKEIELKIRQGKIKIKSDVKLTESTVLAMVSASNEVMTCKFKQFALEKESLLWDTIVSGFDQKRSMLSNEVTLIATNFYQSSNIKGRSLLEDTQTVERGIAEGNADGNKRNKRS